MDQGICEGFWACVTPDGLINAISTVLTIAGAFLVAWLTTKSHRKSQEEAVKEESKKIYLAIQGVFDRLESTAGFLLNEKNAGDRDVHLLIKSVEENLNIIQESEIANKAPSKIFQDLSNFYINGKLFIQNFDTVYFLLKKESYLRYEEYLLDSKAKYYDEITFYIEKSEVLYEDMKSNLKSIKAFYK